MSSFLTKTQSIISEAQNAEDLFTIMKHIPLPNLKNFIDAQLQPMDTNKIRNIYYESSSIHDIITNDVVQYILSYIPYENSMKCINKCFNNLIKKNNDLKIQLRKRNISSQFKNTNTWIVDSSRNDLNSEEIAQGYKGPITSLDKACKIMESGDKIILSEGIHKMEKDFLHYEKDVEIEGVGNCILDTEHTNYSEFYVTQKLSLSNILIQDHFYAEKCDVWLTNCTIGIHISIDDGNLDCMRCKFIDCDVVSAIQVSGLSSLCVNECVFDNCSGGDDVDPVIQIASKYTDHVSLRLIGNTFKNLAVSPIGCQHSTRFEMKETTILQNNSIDPDYGNSDVLRYFLNVN